MSEPIASKKLGNEEEDDLLKLLRAKKWKIFGRKQVPEISFFCRELLDLMQAGTLEPEVAFLNASLVPDVFPVLAAAHKTLVAKSRESLTTRTLHSELVYNYSGSKHISESLKRCGISDTSTYVLVARFGASSDETTAMGKLIKGKEIDLEELQGRANQAQIQKHYKIPGPELVISSVGDAITCRIAARDTL
ncbi:hypothetical protein RJ640_030078 [Escallonia rubra]|uniref:Uncharacterized protein n=1 Tax=Escallonia rubra TaxID=112253 RepID=A0AA88QFV3_9ASTE|nr:hypothetical protein RJ640_030078 [Escallonia rubra]